MAEEGQGRSGGAPGGRLAGLRSRVTAAVEPVAATWAGRVAADTVERSVRVEVFDRAMVIAAQTFTSVVPILILMAVAARGSDLRDVLDSMGATQGIRQVIEKAVDGGSSLGSFGIIGVLLVLLSSTSLSRALARTYAMVWDIGRPASGARAVWRWMAVAVGFAVSLLVVRAFARIGEHIPPAPVWGTLAVAVSYGLLLWPASRVLLGRQVAWRPLLPGALLGGLAIAVISRVSQALWLPAALEVSESRYGTLGVAFTYLSLLYVLAWALIAATALGVALVVVDGPISRWAGYPGGSGPGAPTT